MHLSYFIIYFRYNIYGNASTKCVGIVQREHHDRNVTCFLQDVVENCPLGVEQRSLIHRNRRADTVANNICRK